jgi:hypothetical protein
MMAGRTDIVTISKPVLNYYTRINKLEHNIYISKIPRVKYTRHFLVTKGLEEEYQFVLKFAEAAKTMPAWREALRRHGF